MISLFKQIEDSENLLAGFRALRKAYLELMRVLHRAALPANPELSAQCKEELDALASQLENAQAAEPIDAARKATLAQFEAIYHSNRAALEERDVALKDVVTSIAEAISGFKGHGERHESNLSLLADEFDALARLDDIPEIRRRLRDQVGKLRETAQEMRHENDKNVQQFASQISTYQQRLETARKETGIDRLTALGSRREAEQRLRALSKQRGPATILLFDIEGFRAINDKYGTLFGDKLLRAFAHSLVSQFSEQAALFRWGADEFLVIAEGASRIRTAQCSEICHSFATAGKYSAIVDGGAKAPLTAHVAFGVAQYSKGENSEELYRRARMALEENRKSLRQ